VAAVAAAAGAVEVLAEAVGVAEVPAAEDLAGSEAVAAAEAGPLAVGKQRSGEWSSCDWRSKGVITACSRQIQN
jgi:hypothetical protein